MDSRSPLIDDFVEKSGSDPTIDNILPRLDLRSVARFSQTCRLFRNISLWERIQAQAAHFIIQDPNEIKVTLMLNAHPFLLTAKIKEITDKADRKILNKTLFQLAYGAGDDGMCLAIKPFFIKVYGSEEAGIKEMNKQRSQMFIEIDAEEAEKEEQESKSHLATILQVVIAACNAEQFNLGEDAEGRFILSGDMISAIQIFRKALSEGQTKIITQGMHFCEDMLQQTFDAYVRAAAQWNYSYHKCMLFEDGVLSSVLFYLPENDAQKFSQGLYYLQKTNELARPRSLALRQSGKNFHDVIRGPSSHFVCLGSCWDINKIGQGSGHMGLGMGDLYQSFCQTKKSNLQSLMQPTKPQPTSQRFTL